MAKINAEDIKKELKELDAHNRVFESLDNTSLFDSYSHLGNNDFTQFKSLVSEIRGKQEVIRKLQSLDHNISLLKSIALSKNKDKHHSFMLRVVENNYNSMHSIIADLNMFKAKISDMKVIYETLLNSSLPLDAKILLEQSFKGKHEKLNDIYDRQKRLLLSLSSIFLNIAKKRVFRKG